MESLGGGIILWGLKCQFIPVTGLNFLLIWLKRCKTKHNTMQIEENNQNIIHIITSHADGVLEVSGFGTLKFWCFIHKHIMQSHVHSAQQVLTQGRA
jgi:hypothetical protein